jgi:DNA polymerase I-like protein with 3'-5' exonuclease and polymerase domains/uracil-DNA glycosylase
MKYNIQPEGPRDARIAFVAEKPAAEECQQNRLLIGTTGRMARKHLLRAGVDAGREIWETINGTRVLTGVSQSRDVWLTNAVQSFDEISNPSLTDVVREQARLYRELSQLPNLRVIIAAGNYALASLGNFAYTHQAKNGDIAGIMSYRGSVLQTPLGIKMVPTLPPSFYVRGEWRYRSIVQFDYLRAVEQLAYPEIRRPYHVYGIEPTFDEALLWMEEMADGPVLSFDIETFQWPRKKLHPYTGKLIDSGVWYISCIAFSNSPELAYCIPITRTNREPYWTLDQEAYIWRKIAWLLNLEHKTYVTQNGLFDTWHLRRHGIACTQMAKGFDSMYSHRLRAPDLPHDLGFITSIYTDEPYYKDESGKWESDITVPAKQFWLYNAKDSHGPVTIKNGISSELSEHRMLDYYQDNMQTQWDVLLDMQVRGMRIARDRLQGLRRNAGKIINENQELLDKELGFVPNTKSPIDMSRVFAKYGIVPARTKKSNQAKITEEDLFTYAHHAPASRPSILACIEITRQRTLLSNFLYPALDINDFYHPSYDLSHAKNGRLSSSGADEGGPQAQNWPGVCRSLVIPDDEECEITKADLKQADAMVVAWDSQDEFLIRAFEAKKDMHRIRGCLIFKGWSYDRGIPPDDLLATIESICTKCLQAGIRDCSHSERFISKQSGHAFNYLLGVNKWVTITLPGFGIFISIQEGTRIRDIVLTVSVRAWQNSTNEELKVSPTWLESPCGRKREFYGIADHKMLRDAVSWKGSCPVSHITNQAMVRLHRELQLIPKARVINNGHDSLLINHRKQDRETIYKITDKAFHHTLYYHGRALNIPTDMHSGPSWGEC